MLAIGIDPGLRCTGVAIFNGTWDVFSIRSKAHGFDRIPEICAHLRPGPYDVIVIERPQIYRASKNPNDLAALSVLVGAIAQKLKGRALLPLPREWKGQLPKIVHHKRIRERVPNLGKASKDALDAVGLCLWGIDHTGGSNA